VLSCEPLFMRFLDSQMDGTTTQLFENLAADLRKVTACGWRTRRGSRAPT
jgi:hypothetical protein